MLSTEELEGLLRGGESDRVEFKESLADKNEIRKTICAFANDLPGRGLSGALFVGIRDDGSNSGLRVDDELLRELADIRAEGKVTPIPSMVVQKHNFGGSDVAVVLVAPAAAPPVRLDGRVWVRVGPSMRLASGDDERRLNERRRSFDLPFELRERGDATLEDLDDDMFRRTILPAFVAPDVLAENQRSLEQQMQSLRFLGPSLRPTHLGLLTIGRSPRHFIGCAYVQFLRIEGTRAGGPIKDAKEIDGTIGKQLERIDDLLKLAVSVRVEIDGGPRDRRLSDYPIEALRQLLHNAVLHRTYEGTNAPVHWIWLDDRIEITSPGGAFGQVNPDNFGQPGVVDYRNLHLAGVLKALGYTQRFGVGLARAREELTRNGNPPMNIEVRPELVRVIVRGRFS